MPHLQATGGKSCASVYMTQPMWSPRADAPNEFQTNKMALEILYSVTGPAAALFSWFCSGVVWVFMMPFGILTSVVLYIAEFVFLLCGIGLKAGREFLVGAYNIALSGVAGVGEGVVSYAPSAWDYAKLLVISTFHFLYNVSASIWEYASSVAVHTFVFHKWLVHYVCTDLASYSWSGMVKALEWASSTVATGASYAVAGAARMYTLAVQGFSVTYNGILLGAERVFPAVYSLLGYGAQSGACVIQWGYSASVALFDYGCIFAVQVYKMLEFAVVQIWMGAIPASLYVWNVAIAGLQWAYSFSWTVASHILAAAQVVFSVVADGVLSVWSGVMNVVRHTYPIIVDGIVAGLQWVWDIRYSAHLLWMAEVLWSGICTVGSLLLMVAAQVWALLALLFTYLSSALLMVVNAMLYLALWMSSFIINNFIAVVCCIAVVFMVVKILRCARVIGRGVVAVVLRPLGKLLASLGVQAPVGREQEQGPEQVREGGTAPPVQENMTGEDHRDRATRQQQELLRTVLQDVPQTGDDDRLCVVCFVKDKAIMLRPCNHVCLCTECGKNIPALNYMCPICRKDIANTERVYI